MKLELLKRLAKSWNHLDIGYIADLLSETISYESQWSFTNIQGKASVIFYLQNKFEKIKKEKNKGKMEVRATIIQDLQKTQEYMLLLNQKTKETEQEVGIIIVEKAGKINKISICPAPQHYQSFTTTQRLRK